MYMYSNSLRIGLKASNERGLGAIAAPIFKRQMGTAVTKTAIKSQLELSDGRVPAVAPVTAVAGSKLHTSHIGRVLRRFCPPFTFSMQMLKINPIRAMPKELMCVLRERNMEEREGPVEPSMAGNGRWVNLRSLTDGSRPVQPVCQPVTFDGRSGALAEW
ncbi:hypothetical protein DFH07DRAFT_781392 [Mycena maculata]|uniref:Uncharacterized protein n=1 Tax=Mycena maculata TaxID=230809 RepID=A0AAD7HYF9_9AGAR|nr:hypothetical protein DFH07DRAFT_781392 [Mycena maculata]